MIDEADNLSEQPDDLAEQRVADPGDESAGARPASGGAAGSPAGEAEPRPEANGSRERAAGGAGAKSPKPAGGLAPGQVEDSMGEQDAGERKLDWYILKVQSNREDSIREALQRRINIAGMNSFFDEIIVPVEMVSEFKNGKKRVVKRKLYPGYIVVHMELNEDTWFLVRETPGIGDFTGSGGKPSPMLPHEVSRIVAKQEEKADEAPKLKISFNTGDRVKITEGTFENFEGDVGNIDQANGRVTVLINIFGRSTPVELEYWQIESL